MFASMSGEGWAVVVTAIFLGIAKITDMILVYKREVNKAKLAAVVAVNVKEVAVKQAETSEQITGMADLTHKTHDLVNSAMMEQKRIYAVKCRAMANETHRAADIAEAEAAEQAYREHKEGQEKSDAKEVAELKVKATQHDELKEAVEKVPDKTVEKIKEAGL